MKEVAFGERRRYKEGESEEAIDQLFLLFRNPPFLPASLSPKQQPQGFTWVACSLLASAEAVKVSRTRVGDDVRRKRVED
jgi:hypothetical protein